MATQKEIIYGDIIENMAQNPVTDDVGMAINATAVKDSINGLLLTDKGERLYQPEVGGNIKRLLFENADPFIALELKTEIQATIINDEPRAVLNYVKVQPDIDNNSYYITISFFVINNLEIEETMKVELKAGANGN